MICNSEKNTSPYVNDLFWDANQMMTNDVFFSHFDANE